MIWLRALVFFLVVPGTVLGLIPYLLVGRSDAMTTVPAAARWLGGLLALVGVGVIAWCSIDFVRRGRGTPAPYDPPRDLVAAGLYRHVRNPMYLGAGATVLGEALWTWRIELLAHAACSGRLPPLRALLRGAHAACQLRRVVRALLRAGAALDPAPARVAQPAAGSPIPGPGAAWKGHGGALRDGSTPAISVITRSAIRCARTHGAPPVRLVSTHTPTRSSG